ncbi:TPA: hypothetical protein N0F65_008145 [Lagenidium giganteum]|uniref:Kinesin motor domain-containing protein n=1 Tax=Lagenidium giganteum TaxID=4803 RepID=A0AAV2YKN3_9STRA|nr:TPA: hypothetical protein N0F65_008145 [Lagenidium giganteum]
MTTATLGANMRRLLRTPRPLLARVQHMHQEGGDVLQYRAFASATEMSAEAQRPSARGRAAASNGRHTRHGAPTPKVKLGASKTQQEVQISELMNQTRHPRFRPDTEFLRRASGILHLCKSREQMTGALPLCAVVAQSATMHVSAAMECVRIYQKLGHHRAVVDLVEKLLAHGQFVMNPMLVHALQACAALDDVHKGFALYETAKTRGTIPNMAVYTALLTLAGSAGDFGRTTQVLDQIRADGLELNQAAYHSLMNAYIKAGRVSKALMLAEDMKIGGIAQDEDTYAILMNAYAEQNDFEGAQVLMDTLKASDKLSPALIHYNIMIKACGKASQLPIAFQLYEEMKVNKIQPDLVTYITMMHAVYHGELGQVNTKMVKGAMAGVGCLGLAMVPMIDVQEYFMTALFCGSLVGSMGLAVYMNPDGVQRALYPNCDEPRTEPVIDAFFRRLREEDHCGRSMYLWREMLKFGIPPDPRVYDVLVRTCIKKRHPELAYEALFEQKLPLTDSQGAFVLPMTSTVHFLHSLLVQRRLRMADELFTAALDSGLFSRVFIENDTRMAYDLRQFGSVQVRSFVITKLLERLRQQRQQQAGASTSKAAPSAVFLVQHGYELLDQLDMDHPQVRELFSMDEMTKEDTAPGQFFFRLTAPTCISLWGQQFTVKLVFLNMQVRSLAFLVCNIFSVAPCITGTSKRLDGHALHSPSMASVRVSCRVREQSASENSSGGVCCIDVPADGRTVVVRGDASSSSATGSTSNITSTFSCFDHVFAPSASQELVFNCLGAPLIRDVLAGYDCTFLAYGPTGSGKTHTMTGTVSDHGLLPRALALLLEEISTLKDEQTVELTASYIEVYQEKLRDLLLPHNSKTLRIREDKSSVKGVWVDGATEVRVSSVEKALALVARGDANRARGATRLNDDSSRSHAVFTLQVTTTTTPSSAPHETKRIGRLCLVDLAGSEKARKTSASGQRLEEAKHINRSLAALGNVINCLTDGSKFVPYRDSKLTRLLQHALGGNAKTHLMLTCSSSSVQLAETLSTLRFGARAQFIQNVPRVNYDAPSTSKQRQVLASLEKKLENLYHYIRQLETSRCQRCAARNCVDTEALKAEPATAGTCCSVCRKPGDSLVECEGGCGKVWHPTCSAQQDVTASPPESDEHDVSDTWCSDCRRDHSSGKAELSDSVMHEELNCLRRALTEMQHEMARREHEIKMEHNVMAVQGHELSTLHAEQEKRLQAQESELTELHMQAQQLARDHAALARERADLDQVVLNLRKELLQAKSTMAQRDAAAGAEAEILRRRLESSENETKEAQLELIAARKELKEIKTLLSRREDELKLARDERERWRTLAPVTTAPTPVSPPKTMLRPVTAVELAARGVPGTPGLNIHHWWAGGAREEEPAAPPFEPTELARVRARHVDTPAIRHPVPSKGIDSINGCGSIGESGNFSPNGSNNNRPFRSRLVGLLTSLEEETTSYKELAQETQECNVRRPGGARGKRTLPGLELAASTSSSSSNGRASCPL